jgi:hypothetical protein
MFSRWQAVWLQDIARSILTLEREKVEKIVMKVEKMVK